MYLEMKKVLTITALTIALGFIPYFVSPAQAATTTATEKFREAVASWKPVSDAKCYNIYYKRVKQTKFEHSVRCVPNNLTSYTIGGLKQGRSYEYTVAAVSNSNSEYSWTQAAPLR